jgi:hypothetical protein
MSKKKVLRKKKKKKKKVDVATKQRWIKKYSDDDDYNNDDKSSSSSYLSVEYEGESLSGDSPKKNELPTKSDKKKRVVPTKSDKKKRVVPTKNASQSTQVHQHPARNDTVGYIDVEKDEVYINIANLYIHDDEQKRLLDVQADLLLRDVQEEEDRFLQANDDSDPDGDDASYVSDDVRDEDDVN